MRVIAYRAISTDEQALRGVDFDEQRVALRAAVEARGWTLVADLTDEGFSPCLAPADRPGLARTFTLLRNREADVLVVARLDRLCRSLRDLVDLLHRAEGCNFGIVTLDSLLDTTATAGRVSAAAAGAVAEWERRLIAGRTRAALAAKRAGGTRLGRPVQLPQELRQRVGDLRQQGLSIAKVAAALNQDGRGQGNGAPWTRSAVQRVLRSLQLDHTGVTPPSRR